MTPFIAWPIFKKNLKHPRVVRIIVSVAVALLITIADLFVSLCNLGKYLLVPSYDHVVIASIYLFLPISVAKRSKAYLLAVPVSLIYFAHMVWRLCISQSFVKTRITSYGLYLISLNFVMSFCNFQRLYETRRWVVTRYQLVLQGITFKVGRTRTSFHFELDSNPGCAQRGKGPSGIDPAAENVALPARGHVQSSCVRVEECISTNVQEPVCGRGFFVFFSFPSNVFVSL